MDDNNFQNSLCITSIKQKLSGPIEAHGPFIIIMSENVNNSYSLIKLHTYSSKIFQGIVAIICPSYSLMRQTD